MSKQLFYTWLPCFPGFYESVLYNPDMEFYQERALYLEDQEIIPYSLMEYWLRNRKSGRRGEVQVRYEDYEKDVAKAFCTVAAECLSEALDDCITVEFEGVQRPREYNFRTDTVHCAIAFSPEKAVDYCKAHLEAFQEYLLANYRSRDGFISFHPYEASEWLQIEKWGGHEPGAILDFILRDYLDYDDASYIISEEVLKGVNFADYCDFPEELSDFLDSPEAEAIAAEYERLMTQGELYLEAMGHTPRAEKLIAEGVESLKQRLSREIDACLRAY